MDKKTKNILLVLIPLIVIILLLIAIKHQNNTKQTNISQTKSQNITNILNYLDCKTLQQNNIEFCKTAYEKYKLSINPKLYNSEKNSCQYYVQIQKAFKQKNMSICQQIETMPHYSQQNENYVQICSMLIIKNQTSCNKLDYDSKNKCYSFFDYLNNKDSYICNEEPNTCLWIKATREQNSEICKQIKHPNTKVEQTKLKKCQILAGHIDAQQENFCDSLLTV